MYWLDFLSSTILTGDLNGTIESMYECGDVREIILPFSNLREETN